MTRWWVGPGVVLASGIVLGVATAFVAPEQFVWVNIPIGTCVFLAALLAAIGWAGFLAVRMALRSAYTRGHEMGTATERDAHRRFVARLDHELKNPITAIRAAVAVAHDDHSASVDEATRTQLAIADAQATRLALLVADLRKLAEFENQDLEYEYVNVEEVAQDAVTDILGSCSARSDSRTITPHFPRAPWPIPAVSGDPDLLYLALYNLLSNAVKFSPVGSPIEVRGSEENGNICIEVADVGIGIPEEELPTVTDELARGKEARGIPGSGIGLALVRVIAERHGGSLSLRSRHGSGTSAHLRIPISSSHSAERTHRKE